MSGRILDYAQAHQNKLKWGKLGKHCKLHGIQGVCQNVSLRARTRCNTNRQLSRLHQGKLRLWITITITAALPVNENIYSVHCDHASVKCHHQLIWYTVIRQWGGHGVRHREETRRCLFFLHSVQNQTKSSRQTIVSLFLLLPTHVRVQSLCFYLQLVSKTLVPSSSPRGGTKTFLRGTKSTFVRALLLLLLDVRLQAVHSSWKRPPSDQRALKCSTPSCCENLLFGLENESLDILSNLLIIMKTSYSCHREERARGGEEQLTLASVFLHWSAFRPTFMTPAVLCWTNAVLPHQWSMHGSKYECDDLWALVITWGV